MQVWRLSTDNFTNAALFLALFGFVFPANKDLIHTFRPEIAPAVVLFRGFQVVWLSGFCSCILSLQHASKFDLSARQTAYENFSRFDTMKKSVPIVHGSKLTKACGK